MQMNGGQYTYTHHPILKPSYSLLLPITHTRSCEICGQKDQTLPGMASAGAGKCFETIIFAFTGCLYPHGKLTRTLISSIITNRGFHKPLFYWD
jgi:hypothetical protein